MVADVTIVAKAIGTKCPFLESLAALPNILVVRLVCSSHEEQGSYSHTASHMFDSEIAIRVIRVQQGRWRDCPLFDFLASKEIF